MKLIAEGYKEVTSDKGELRNEVRDMAAIEAILKNDLGVKRDYRHAPKWVTPGESVETSGAVLKWYGLHPEDQPVPGEIDLLARAYLVRNTLEAKGLGFVILHRCGDDFYFLIVNT